MVEIKNKKGEVIYTYNGDTLVMADLHGLDLHEADLMGVDLSGANLTEANLTGADLSLANLYKADICEANLFGANFTWARLTSADLSHSDLSGANLHGADLYSANLSYADLTRSGLQLANLFGANLHLANLLGANLYKANLHLANLLGANLYKADICEANLNSACLSGANLDGIRYDETTKFFALQCPEKGSFIAYKKVKHYIVELEIPEDAKRSSATTRKCRCSKAKVLGIYDSEHNLLDIQEVINVTSIITISDTLKTAYKVGEFVYPDSWDEDRWNECSHGIHFFMTFQEAVNYKN